MASPLPPRVPTDLPALDQAITLLGNRTKDALTAPARRKLVDLVGTYPDQKTAAVWKATLKEIRRELVAEGPADESHAKDATSGRSEAAPEQR